MGVSSQKGPPYVPLFLVAAGAFVLDQVTKHMVVTYIRQRHGDPKDVLGGNVSIVVAHNTGAAFGILPNQTFLFVAIATAVIIGIVISYRRLMQAPLALRIALGLILGGALGNLVDRLRYGFVVDFVDLHWWPVFNIADTCIVVGVFLLMSRLALQAEPR